MSKALNPLLPHSLTRRHLMAGAAATGAMLALPATALAQTAAKTPLVGPLAPNPAEFKKTVQQFLGSAKPVSEGLQLDVAVLAELNHSPLTCRLRFTADTGTAEAAVRVRLSQTQTIHAMARMKSGKVLVAKQAVTVAASGCGM